jgi:hypothetical protein
MSDVDNHLRSALRDLAQDAPDGEGLFERTQTRITRIRRRRAFAGATVVVALLATGVGALVAAVDNDRNVQVGPPPPSGAPAPTTTTPAPTTTAPTTTSTTSTTTVPPGAVPDVRGLTEADALQALRAAGYDPAVERVGAPVGSGEVFGQRPAAGEPAPAGYPVRIWTCGPGADCAAPDRPELQFVTWKTSESPVWSELGGQVLGATPDDVLAVVLDRFRANAQFQATTYDGEVVAGDGMRAVIELRSRNLPDDSVYGTDVEVTLRNDGSGWRIESARQRELCGRGSGYPAELCV